MFNVVRKEITWGGRTLILETGKIARQADGAVLATYGGTVVLCTVVAAKTVKAGVDFFPLTVHYQEKTFAAGKIPGGFFKREGRPSERETLTSRLIDRPIRPLFPDHFYNETQIVCTVLSYDPENDSDVVAVVGASAAIAISGIPMLEPIGAARVGYVDGEYVINPQPEILARSSLDLVVAGTVSSVLMVESEANCLSEEIMLGAVSAGHQAMQPVIQAIREMAAQCGNKTWEVVKPDYAKLQSRVKELATEGLRAAYDIRSKQERRERIDQVKNDLMKILTEEATEEAPLDPLLANYLFKKLEQDLVRGNILDKGMRIDGRDVSTVRPIETEVGFLPRVHGAALFTRGETQALVTTTLGTTQDEQIIDNLVGDNREHFMLHYNFPPFSVGEATPMRAPGRREIGHGKLAWRAVRPLLPEKEAFPYTIRVVSEITESNGSSSMASVCGASLSMMDAGVPLKAPVAGIAMGLIKEGERYAVLSDIMGDEDHLGDMDFKVAGTEAGITALQMDIKINGITTEIMAKALEQAKAGRLHILGRMSSSISNATGLKDTAPRITTINIDKERIGELIGPGGKVIREICESTGAKIDVDDTGTVKVAAVNQEMGEHAMRRIREIFEEAEMDKIYDGKVSKLLEFGAVVQFLGKCSGLVHVSEISGERIANVEDALSVGQAVKVKVIGKERGDRGERIRLSMRRVDQTTGDEIPLAAGEDEASGDFQPRERRERSDRGDRSGERRGGGRRDDRRSSGDRYSGERREGGERRERSDRDRNGDRRDRGPRHNGERSERRNDRHDDDHHNRQPKHEADDNRGNRIDDNAQEQPKKRRWFL